MQGDDDMIDEDDTVIERDPGYQACANRPPSYALARLVPVFRRDKVTHSLLTHSLADRPLYLLCEGLSLYIVGSQLFRRGCAVSSSHSLTHRG